MLDEISYEEFFEGYSVPGNKEIMRIFRDLDLVEQLGSGIPRILQTYSRECFKFSDNFLRMSFPINQDLQTLIEEKKTGGAIDGAIGGAIFDLTERQNEIFELIKIQKILVTEKLLNN